MTREKRALVVLILSMLAFLAMIVAYMQGKLEEEMSWVMVAFPIISLIVYFIIVKRR